MKTSVKKDRKSGSSTLLVTPGKREELEYAQAEWLRGATERCLLPFQYQSDGGLRLYYDLTGTLALDKYLATKITAGQYVDMLARIYEVLALCTRRNYPMSCVCFDPGLVYVDGVGGLKLAFVPLKGMAERKGDSPRDLLAHLANRSKVKFVVEGDDANRAALDDFVRRTPVMSLKALEGFLEDKMGLSPDDDVTEVPAGERGASGGLEPQPSSATVPPAGGAVSLDMVSLLMQSASASEVKAGQTVAQRTLDEVAGVSPTAASRNAAVARPVVPAAPNPVRPGVPVPPSEVVSVKVTTQPAAIVAGEPQPAAASTLESRPAVPVTPAPAPSRPDAQVSPTPAASEPGATPVAAPAVEVPVPPVAKAELPRHQTVMLGGGARSFAAGFAQTGQTSFSRARRPQVYMERLNTGERVALDLVQPKVVGRSASSDVTLVDNTNISRRHVEVSRDVAGFSLRDLGSLNGTTVRGSRLQKGVAVHVDAGEEFQIADETVRLVEQF